MTDTLIDHGTAEKFCPRCFDYRTGSVEEHELHAVVAWTCPACDYHDDIGNVPHDADEYDEYIEYGIINEGRL